MQTLNLKEFSARIDQGELVSFRHGDHEFIHQKGDPGWRNSDTEMFPIIGPTAEAAYRVHVPRGNAIQDQHGLLREMEYDLVAHSDTGASYRKTYVKGTVVMNSKYPERSTAQRLIWPFDFEFEKHFRLTETGLTVSFQISGEKDMPFMLGYHPAFKLHVDSPVLSANDNSIELQEVLDVGSRALEVPNCSQIVLEDQRSLKLESRGFSHFMLWTEVPNMVCIEPITFYPYAVAQTDLHEGFMHLDSEKMIFELTLTPV